MSLSYSPQASQQQGYSVPGSAILRPAYMTTVNNNNQLFSQAPPIAQPGAADMLYKQSGSYPTDAEAAPLVKPEQRKRKIINLQSILIACLIPPLLFTAMVWALSGDVRRHHGHYAGLIAVLCILVVIAIALSAAGERKKSRYAEPSWLIFLCITAAIACISGLMMGEYNYRVHMKSVFDMRELNMYVDIDPSKYRGEQLMDAGIVQFAKGTLIDTSRSMGFKNKDMYCVAPISFVNASVATYDLWAVGTNCCAGNQATFNCNMDAAHRGLGAVRLMSDKHRPYYRLAVQQAEAMYGIRALHPLFFTWVGDVVGNEATMRHDGQTFFLSSISIVFILNVFVVAVATVGFSKVLR